MRNRFGRETQAAIDRASAGRDGRESTMLVRDLMRRQVATIGPDASLALAARTMRDRDVGCLPVLERERLIGMITDRDIAVRGVAEGLDPYRAIVREVMSTVAVTGSEDDTLEAARELMMANLIKHLPVLDHHEHLVGLVALRDISGTFAKCRPHQVTFYKRLPNSSGHVCNVEVARVYLSPAVKKGDLESAAVARFERDRGLARWDQAADLFELQDNH
jgi:CBS domain-containing protein